MKNSKREVLCMSPTRQAAVQQIKQQSTTTTPVTTVTSSSSSLHSYLQTVLEGIIDRHHDKHFLSFLHLSQSAANHSVLSLTNFSLLRPAETVIKRAPDTVTHKYPATFLSFQLNPLARSLTLLQQPHPPPPSSSALSTASSSSSLSKRKDEREQLERNERFKKLSKTVFLRIKCIMEQEKNEQNCCIVIKELIQIALDESYIRDELYCQLIKQTTKNPNLISLIRGVKLILVCCCYFSPTHIELRQILLTHISHTTNEQEWSNLYREMMMQDQDQIDPLSIWSIFHNLARLAILIYLIDDYQHHQHQAYSHDKDTPSLLYLNSPLSLKEIKDMIVRDRYDKES